MRLLPFALTSLPLAASTPLGGRSVSDTLTEHVNIDLQVNKATSEAAIEVWTQDRSQLLAQSCFATAPGHLYLNNGHFSKSPIDVQINNNGRGNITIGDKSIMIHSNPDISGGIECNSIISGGETIVSCLAPVLDQVVQSSKASHLAVQDCFPSGALELTEVMRAASEGREVTPYAETLCEMKLAAKMIAVNETAATKNPEDITKRQYNPCSIWSLTTRRVGNGDPHQTDKHIQLSDPVDCQNGECTVGYNAVKSHTIGFTVGSELTSWINGEFSVEKSVETGNSFECSGTAYEVIAV